MICLDVNDVEIQLVAGRLGIEMEDLQIPDIKQYIKVYGDHDVAQIYCDAQARYYTSLVELIQKDLIDLKNVGVSTAEYLAFDQNSKLVKYVTFEQKSVESLHMSKFLQQLIVEARIVRDDLVRKKRTIERLEQQDKKIEQTAFMSDKEVALLQDSAARDHERVANKLTRLRDIRGSKERHFQELNGKMEERQRRAEEIRQAFVATKQLKYLEMNDRVHEKQVEIQKKFDEDERTKDLKLTTSNEREKTLVVKYENGSCFTPRSYAKAVEENKRKISETQARHEQLKQARTKAQAYRSKSQLIKQRIEEVQAQKSMKLAAILTQIGTRMEMAKAHSATEEERMTRRQEAYVLKQNEEERLAAKRKLADEEREKQRQKNSLLFKRHQEATKAQILQQKNEFLQNLTVSTVDDSDAEKQKMEDLKNKYAELDELTKIMKIFEPKSVEYRVAKLKFNVLSNEIDKIE